MLKFQKIEKNIKTTKGSLGLEYIVLFAVVIGFLAIFMGPLGTFQSAYNSVISPASFGMLDMAQRVALSRGESEETYTEGDDANIDGDGYSSGGGSGIGGGGGSGGGSGGSSGGSSGGGGFGGGSSGGGGTVVGGGGGSSGGGSGGGDSVGGSGSSGSSGGGSTTPPPGQTVDSDITDVLALLNGTNAGQYYYDLVAAKKISVIYDDFSKYSDAGVSGNTLGFWWGPIKNTIYINQKLKSTMAQSAIATVIIHEANHADYSYNSEKVIAATLARHSELTRDDLNIYRYPDSGDEITFSLYDPETDADIYQVMLGNSIDQEYMSFGKAAELWKETKGTDTDQQMDYVLSLYEQGEADLKAILRTVGGYGTLPQY